MDRPPTIFAAPWGRLVKIATLFGSAVLLGISLLEAFVLPRHLLGGWPWLIGVSAPLVIVAGCALFVVRGYALEPRRLRVRRLAWDTQIDLGTLRQAWATPDAMSGSWRLFGNGGLFSLTGLFRSRRLGKFRAYAMDPARGVVLEFESGRILVTPDSPHAFLEQLRIACPAVRIGPPS